jgi:hypothetical protein
MFYTFFLLKAEVCLKFKEYAPNFFSKTHIQKLDVSYIRGRLILEVIWCV